MVVARCAPLLLAGFALLTALDRRTGKTLWTTEEEAFPRVELPVLSAGTSFYAVLGGPPDIQSGLN